MEGSVTKAAWIFSGAIVLASIIVACGAFLGVHSAMERFEASLQRHGDAVEQAGGQMGQSIGQSFDGLTRAFEQGVVPAMSRHGQSIEQAGGTVAGAFEAPLRVGLPPDEAVMVGFAEPVPIRQPVAIQGLLEEDGALPVQVRMFE